MTPHDNAIKVLLTEFRLGDCEDPELYAAEPIYKWQQTEEGQWAKQNCSDMFFVVQPEFDYYGYKCKIFGYLSPELALWFLLKR